MVVKTEESFLESIRSLESGLITSMRQRLELTRSSLREFTRLLADPRRVLEQYSQRVDELAGRLATGLRHYLRRDRALLAALAAGLDHLNPLGILSRGFSITKKLPAGKILKDASEIKLGDMISTKLHRGELVSRVEKRNAS